MPRCRTTTHLISRANGINRAERYSTSGTVRCPVFRADRARNPSRGALLRQQRVATTATDLWRCRSLGTASRPRCLRSCRERGRETDNCARSGRISRSTGCDGYQGGYSHEISCASHDLGQGGETEIPADIAEPARQERALASRCLRTLHGLRINEQYQQTAAGRFSSSLSPASGASPE